MRHYDKSLLKIIIQDKLRPDDDYDLHDEIYVFECISGAVNKICGKTWVSRISVTTMITECLNEYIEKEPDKERIVKQREGHQAISV